jgi:signal transduction histidine kinase
VLRSRWRAYRPPTADLLLAAAFILAGQAITWWELETPTGYEGPRGMNAVLNLLFLAAIAWRRRAPLAALCWAVGVFLVPHVVVPHDITFFGGGVPLAFMTASAGYYCARRRALVAAFVALLAVVMISVGTPSMRSIDSYIFNLLLLLGPWAGARGLRVREDRAGALAAELATERAATEAALERGAAAERAHIARELHDIVAHNVSMMVIQVGAARMQLPSDCGPVEAPLLAAEEAGRQTLEDLRRLLGVLRADERAAEDADQPSHPEPPQPGLARLDVLVAPVRSTGLDVAVEIEGDPVVLPSALDLTAYRIVQEALTNTIKHSGATTVTVRLN